MFSPNSFTSNPKTPEEDVFPGLLSMPLSFALKLPGGDAHQRGSIAAVAVAILMHQHPVVFCFVFLRAEQDTFMTAAILWLKKKKKGEIPLFLLIPPVVFLAQLLHFRADALCSLKIFVFCLFCFCHMMLLSLFID